MPLAKDMRIRVKYFVASSKTHDIDCMSFIVTTRRTESPNQFATMRTTTTPYTGFGFSDAKMNRMAPCTFCFPLRGLLNREWNRRLPCWIAHKLKRQRHTCGTPTSVSGQTLRTLVFVVRLLAGFTGCLPVGGHDNRFAACVASPRRGSEFLCNSLPRRAMPSFRPSKGMGDFMQQRIEDLFRRIVSGVVFGDLNSFRPVFARTLPTFRSGPSERPIVQPVLQEFPLCNGFQFLQVHTSNPWQCVRATSFDIAW